MEAEIYCKEGLSTSKKFITDIDVLALCPSNFGKFSLVLGDCKTLKNQSPISRALWLGGLMQRLKAQKGIIVLDKAIEQDHKIAAAELNVTLLSYSDMDKYALCITKEYKSLESALCLGDSWDKYFSIDKRFLALKGAIQYVKYGFWNKEDSRLKLRSTLLTLREIKSELNPIHRDHIGLVADLISLFSVALNEVVMDIFDQYLLPETKNQLSDDLKLLIWGGIENYKYWNDLYSRVKSPDNESDLSLPEWDLFIQTVRQCLEEPMATNAVPLLMRELAFEFFAPETSGTWKFSNTLANENLQAARFSIFITEYVCKATKLPPDFKDALVKRLMEIQS